MLNGGESPPTFERKPFSEQKKQKLPTALIIRARDDGYLHHVVIEQIGYLLLSEAALNVLREFQTEGWEAFPMKARPDEKRLLSKLAGDTYYLLNVFLHRDIIDLGKSNLPPKIWHKGTPLEKTTHELTNDCRQIAIKADLVGNMSLWTGGRCLYKNSICSGCAEKGVVRHGDEPGNFRAMRRRVTFPQDVKECGFAESCAGSPACSG